MHSNPVWSAITVHKHIWEVKGVKVGVYYNFNGPQRYRLSSQGSCGGQNEMYTEKSSYQKGEWRNTHI